MSESSKPWPKPIGDASKGTPWDGALHRELWGAALGDGVLGDLTGQELAVSLVSGTTARLQPGRASVRGHRYINDAVKDLTIPTVSGSGNTRLDRLVLHYDPAQTTPTGMITAKVITGVAAASPVPPSLTRAEGSGWMVPIAGWRRTTSGVDNLLDLRSWLGPTYTISDPAALPSDAPLGSVAFDVTSSGRWWRKLVSGSLAWVSDTPLASAYVTSPVTPGSGQRETVLNLTQSTLQGGMTMPDSSRILIPDAGLYRVEAQIRCVAAGVTASNTVTSSINADGNPICRGFDYVPQTTTGTQVTVSAVRPIVDLAAGTVITWSVITSAGGGILLSAGQLFSTICIQKVG